MATPWDRAATKYLEEWVPRFVPYHQDLVRELALVQGQRVLVVSSGPGAEVLAVARAVGDRGFVRATDRNEDLVKVCCDQLEKAGFGKTVECICADPSEVGDGEWNAIVCAFGLWNLENRRDVMARWAPALAPKGKVGVLTFGPPTEDDPFEVLARALKDLEPQAVHRPTRIDPTREGMATMFEDAGLSLVRHTILRHTVTFATAEAFIDAIREGRTWGKVWDELGAERMGRVTARFYDQVGGPTEALVFEPVVTLAVAARPGEEVELASRPSVTAPPLSGHLPKADPKP